MKLVFSIFLCLFLSTLVAQSTLVKEKYFSINQGLSDRHVTAITQDSSGLIWIGTKNGLNLFDGFDFNHFSSSGDSSKLLSNNTINDISLDQNKNIWVANQSGIDILNPSRKLIQSIPTATIFPINKNIKIVKQFNFLQNGRMFFSSFESPCSDSNNIVTEKIGSEYKQLILQTSESKFEYISEIFEDKDLKTWVRPANSYKIFQIDPDHKIQNEVDLENILGEEENLNRFLSSADTNSAKIFGCNHLKAVKISSYYQNDSSFLLVSLKDTNYRKSYLVHLEFRQISNNIPKGIRSKYLLNFLNDQNGGFVFQDESNLLIAKRKSTDTLQLSKVNSENKVEVFFQSSDKTIWLGSPFGLTMFKTYKQRFKTYLNEQENSLGFKNSIRALEFNQGDIYATINQKGVGKVNTLTNQNEILISKRYPSAKKMHEINPYGIIFHDSMLWLANRFDPGILRFNLKNKRLEHLVDSSNLEGFGTCLYQDGSILWEGTDQGINLINLVDREIKLFEPSNKLNTKNFKINCFYRVDENQLLVGTNHSGIFLINSELEFISLFNKEKGLSSNEILSINFSENNLWVGTVNGLNKINWKTKKLVNYTKRDGLTNNKIYSILVLNKNIWCATDFGISIYRSKSNSFYNINKPIELPHIEFNFHAVKELSSNSGLLGGLNGIVWVSDSTITSIEPSTKILLTQITKYNSDIKEFKNEDFHQNESIQIEPKDNLLTFHFTTDNYFDSETTNYYYQIIGLDKSWIPLGNQNKLRINRLPAGSYILKIKALSSSGEWTKNELNIPIDVIQVFYKRLWFILLCFFLGIIFLYLIYSARIKNLKKLEKLRLKIAADLHDEVGSQLTYLSIQAELIQGNNFNEKELNKELLKIGDGVRNAIKTMGDIVWSIDSRKDKVGDIADRMQDYLAEINAKSHIDFELNLNSLPNSKKINIESKQNLYLIFKEGITNILKHSGTDRAIINFSGQYDKLTLEIIDFGKSNPKMTKKGLGLKNIEMRVSKMKGKFTIDKTSGFKLKIEIPS